MKTFNVIWHDGTVESWPIKSFFFGIKTKVLYLDLDKLDDPRKQLNLNTRFLRAWWVD